MGETPFLTARPPEEERRQPVRPMIADSDEEISYTSVEGVKAVMVEDEATGLMWWTAEGDEAGEEADEVEKNPFRRWADEEVEVDREGLGQDGIRPDPQRHIYIYIYIYVYMYICSYLFN